MLILLEHPFPEVARKIIEPLCADTFAVVSSRRLAGEALIALWIFIKVP